MGLRARKASVASPSCSKCNPVTWVSEMHDPESSMKVEVLVVFKKKKKCHVESLTRPNRSNAVLLLSVLEQGHAIWKQRIIYHLKRTPGRLLGPKRD